VFAALQAMGAKAPQIEKEVRLCHPAQDIIDLATEDKTDLIIMGSRGLSPMEGLLLGSVSTKVLQHAPCAVTIVR
jgi:nucleotide-binding universal stress UspA family protein